MWRKLTPDDLSSCIELFDDRSFFYGTGRPDTLSGPVVEALLTGRRWRQYVYGDGTALAGIRAEDRDNASALIRFRAGDMSAESRAPMLSEFIRYAFNTLNYRKLHAHAFEFDSVGRQDFDAVGMTVEAVLSGHVYKSARYFDVLIYGMCRPEEGAEQDVNR